MTLTTKEIISRVALLLGENPQIMSDPGDSAVPMLADRILTDLEACAAEVILATPKMQLTGWRLLDDSGMRHQEDGSVMLPLPSDFLMLFSLRLSDWERDVSAILAPGEWPEPLQRNRWRGLRGTPSRPVAVMEPDPSTGGRALHLYSTRASTPRLAEGWYMPAPAISPGGEIEIPDCVAARLVRLIATRISREVTSC